MREPLLAAGARLALAAALLLVACATAQSPTGAVPSPSPSSSPGPSATGTPTATGSASPTPAASPTPSPSRTAAPPVQPAATPTTPAPVAAGIPNFSHIAVVLMENEGYGDIIGNSSAPYINSLASQGALATQYYAVSHPSLPNYLALTGGSTFGVTSDCSPSPSCAGTTSVVEEMAAAGISWKGYLEDLPGPCAQSSVGNYAVHHNPFVYYPGVVSGECGNVVAASQLNIDIAAGNLARFVWLTPNRCNDMHDCSIATGDAYLSGVLPPLLGALGGNAVLFLVWDEGTSDANGGGRVTMVAVGPGARAGYRSSNVYSHYSLLRTIEDAWGLPPLRNSAQAPAMADLFS